MNSGSLQLTGLVHVSPTADQLYDDLAGLLVTSAMSAIEKRGAFHLALSGGSTPEPFYHRLVIDPRYRAMPWPDIHVWIVDERRVPHDDEQSNYRMIRESLVDHVPIRRRCVHPIHAASPDAADRYNGELQEHVADGRLDFVLLGMGADAHTASLFPGSPALREQSRWATVNEGEGVTPPDRVTMTYPLLNRARELAVLVTGASKRDTLRRVDEHVRAGAADAEQLPITGIDPDDGELTWFLDADAAG